VCHGKIDAIELSASYNSKKIGHFFEDPLLRKITTCHTVYDIVVRRSEME